MARADRPRCTEVPSDTAVRTRLTTLRTMIRNEEPGVRRWWTSFAVLHTSMLTGSLLLGVSAGDEGYRNEMIVGTTSSTLALASLVIFLPPLMGAGDSIDAMPEDTPVERLAKMRAAEDRLRRASAGVDFLHSWVPTTLSLGYVAAAAGTLLLAFDRNVGAFTHSIGGTILSLARVLLHPSGPQTAWRRYRNAYPDAGCQPLDEPVAQLPGPSWQLSPAGGGMSLTVRF